MGKMINFKARSKTEFDVQPKPYPAVKTLPKWFLDAKPYTPHFQDPATTSDGKFHVRGGVANTNFKKCTPLLDGMSMGYIVPLWADVEIDSIQYERPEIFWRTIANVFELHGVVTRDITPPEGYHPQVYKYNNCWIPQTPKGYSCLITSPIGHNDLTIKAVPAVVDTDKSTLELVFPVWVKNNFQGVVEKGTPIVQIIPFKRDDWESTFDYYKDGEYKHIVEEKNFASTLISHYIRNHWSKKTFK